MSAVWRLEKRAAMFLGEVVGGLPLWSLILIGKNVEV